MLELLKDRVYIRYWLAVVVSFLGDAMTRVTLIYVAARLTNSPVVIALVVFSQLLPSGVLGAFVGPLTDRFPKRILLVGADLDTLLIALYVQLTDRIIPWLRPKQRGGPGRPPVVSDAELVCLAAAQVLLRYHDERHWLRAAPSRVGHLFPRLLSQPTYNRRIAAAAGRPGWIRRWCRHAGSTAR
jgi:hypothetical protein